MQPSLFISHGSPTLFFDDVPARSFLSNYGPELVKEYGKPKAILAVSAHWETEVPTVNDVKVNETIHDFYGFPQHMYEMQYPAQGSSELSIRVQDLLAENGIRSKTDKNRGLDHGAYIPLMLMFPQVNIPVVQLSIQPHLGAGHHLAIGRALQKLREENVLIMASGSLTHNLRALKWREPSNPAAEDDWSKEFAAWFKDKISAGKTCDLLSYRRLAPYAMTAHPRDEHLLPIFVAIGAAYPDYKPTLLHESVTFGNLHMEDYKFE